MMFTGLVEEVGTIRKVEKAGGSRIFSIAGSKAIGGLKIKDSICVDGVCLTVVKRRGRTIRVQAVEETLRKTTLGKRIKGDLVNLERPLLSNARLGGHFVLGHVDGVGKVVSIAKRRSSWMIRITVPKRFRELMIPVGSIAVNGVSLTIADLKGQELAVSIIPHTWKVTTFSKMQSGDAVNIEFDVLGKYVQRILKHKKR